VRRNAGRQLPQRAQLRDPFVAQVVSEQPPFFQVALSFAGEQRPLAAAVADRLSATLGRDQVFYDRYYEADLARLDLDIYLQALYHERSRLVVVILGKDYNREEWPGLEWRAVRDLIKMKSSERIVLVRVDDAPVPGVFGLDGYLDARHLSPELIADHILERLRRLEPSPTPGSGAREPAAADGATSESSASGACECTSETGSSSMAPGSRVTSLR
jgi:hypothetical protein